MTSTIIIAALALMAGTLLGFLACAILGAINVIKAPSETTTAATTDKRKMGAMDKILILEGAILITYTVVDMWIFYKTGSEPTTLTMCVFTVCGVENGVMGWIKTTKEKQTATTETTTTATETVDPAELVDREEPADVGK